MKNNWLILIVLIALSGSCKNQYYNREEKVINSLIPQLLDLTYWTSPSFLQDFYFKDSIELQDLKWNVYVNDSLQSLCFIHNDLSKYFFADWYADDQYFLQKFELARSSDCCDLLPRTAKKLKLNFPKAYDYNTHLESFDTIHFTMKFSRVLFSEDGDKGLLYYKTSNWRSGSSRSFLLLIEQENEEWKIKHGENGMSRI